MPRTWTLVSRIAHHGLPLTFERGIDRSTDRPFGIAEENEYDGMTTEEIDSQIRARDAKGKAITLKIIGDIPDEDVEPPDDTLFVCKLNPCVAQNATSPNIPPTALSCHGQLRSHRVWRGRIGQDHGGRGSGADLLSIRPGPMLQHCPRAQVWRLALLRLHRVRGCEGLRGGILQDGKRAHRRTVQPHCPQPHCPQPLPAALDRRSSQQLPRSSVPSLLPAGLSDDRLCTLRRRIHVDFSQSVGKLWNQFNRGESAAIHDRYRARPHVALHSCGGWRWQRRLTASADRGPVGKDSVTTTTAGRGRGRGKARVAEAAVTTVGVTGILQGSARSRLAATVGREMAAAERERMAGVARALVTSLTFS